MVVVNTSPLIAFGRIGRLTVLKAMYGHIVCPEAVIQELRAGQDHGGFSLSFLDEGWVRIAPNPPEVGYRRELGDGETSVILHAYQNKSKLVVLDDLPARLYATSLGLAVTGTLGVLMAASKEGILGCNLKQAIQELIHVGFYLPKAICLKYGICHKTISTP